MEIQFRPLGKVMEIASNAGFDITYAFDDLAFSDHSVFIIRFDKKLNDLFYLYLNVNCDVPIKLEIKKNLFKAANQHKITLKDAGMFFLSPKHGTEEIDIRFFEDI